MHTFSGLVYNTLLFGYEDFSNAPKLLTSIGTAKELCEKILVPVGAIMIGIL